MFAKPVMDDRLPKETSFRKKSSRLMSLEKADQSSKTTSLTLKFKT